MNARCIVALAAVLGCGQVDEEAAEDGDTSAESGTSTSTSTSTSTTSSTSTSGSSTEGSTGLDASSEASSTGPAPACDFEAIVCEAAEQSETMPVDCGFVTLQDEQAAWQAAYDCFRDAFLDQTAAKLLWQNMAIDSTNYSAMVAQQGGAYTLLRFDYDDFMGDVQAQVRGCTGITEDPMCTVDVGEMCLQCMDPAEPTPLCE